MTIETLEKANAIKQAMDAFNGHIELLDELEKISFSEPWQQWQSFINRLFFALQDLKESDKVRFDDVLIHLRGHLQCCYLMHEGELKYLKCE